MVGGKFVPVLLNTNYTLYNVPVLLQGRELIQSLTPQI